MPIQTTDIDATIGDAFDFTGSVQNYIIAAGVSVVSEGGDGIGCGFSFCEVENYGQVAASFSGVNANGGGCQIVNETTGSITGEDGIVITSSSNDIENDGKISASINGIEDGASGNNIYNYGAITARDNGIVAGSGDFVYNSGQIVSDKDGAHISTSGNVTFENVGTVKGRVSSVSCSGTGKVALTNRSVLDGNVSLSEKGAATFRNAGAIYGAVAFANGAANTFDGRGGTVEGTIAGGSGADTIRLGNDGETVNGRAGHDVIYGGTGHDTFAFSSILGADSDHVYNFSVAADKIQLNHAEFTALKPGA